jgi:hypothetical protein
MKNRSDLPSIPQAAFDWYDEYAHGDIDRRTFIRRLSTLGVAGLTVSAVSSALLPNYAMAEQVSFNDPDITAKYIEIDAPSGHGKAGGYLVTPNKVTKDNLAPAVLVVHENRGLNPYIEDVARRLAKAGFVAFAPDVVQHLSDQGEKIIWAPDQHLGRYVQSQTGADVLLWDGACIVHEEFKAKGIHDLKAIYPDAAVLVHPESPESVVEIADVVGSTSQLLKASKELSNQTFIVATDRGIFYKMKQASPEKRFVEAPTAGSGATCRSCAHCPWMALNSLELLRDALRDGTGEIFVDEQVRVKGLIPLQRMLDFKKSS